MWPDHLCKIVIFACKIDGFCSQFYNTRKSKINRTFCLSSVRILALNQLRGCLKQINTLTLDDQKLDLAGIRFFVAKIWVFADNFARSEKSLRNHQSANPTGRAASQIKFRYIWDDCKWFGGPVSLPRSGISDFVLQNSMFLQIILHVPKSDFVTTKARIPPISDALARCWKADE